LVASKSAIVAERFFRKPDFQLRDFGASAPDVSFNKNVSSSFARHPVIVTAATVGTATSEVVSAAAFGVVSTAGELDPGSIAVALTDSTTVVFSIDAFAAADLAPAAVAGDFGATGFVSSCAEAAACSGSTIARCGTIAAGSAIASGSAIAFGGALMLATLARSDGWRAAIRPATAKTPISPKRIARGLVNRAATKVA
jgi:hypothetical protein